MPVPLPRYRPDRAVVLLSALAALLALVAGAVPARADEGFYLPPSPLPAGKDGDVIKSQPSTYNNATATRVMYRSRDARNRPIAVTGTVIVPHTPWQGPGERPVVAYAPFTAGLGDQCAPSKTLAGEGNPDLAAGFQNNFVDALLGKGFAVAQTDYEGLGTPGEHPYVVRLSEGHAVLDVLRAARRLQGAGLPEDGPLGIAGYSEGGAGAASAAELARSHAPELDIKGAYVGAAPADKAVLAKALDGGMYAGFLAYALIGFDAAYAELGVLDQLSNSAGRQLFDEARTTCVMDSVSKYQFKQSSSLTKDGRPVAAYLAEPPFSRIVAANRIGTVKPSMPVLVEHARDDDVIPYAVGNQLAKDWRGKGADVEFRDLFVAGPLAHTLAMPAAAGDAANWLNERFTGRKAGDSLGGCILRGPGSLVP